jgi:hypothetical protein
MGTSPYQIGQYNARAFRSLDQMTWFSLNLTNVLGSISGSNMQEH